MEPLHLIAGLGNPGREYAGTRHNAGFMVLDVLARRWQAEWHTQRRLGAKVARVQRPGGQVLLCQPQTYMNLSGEAVRRAVDYYQVPITGVLVVVDDADLPLGTVRLRPEGSSAGHHGLESIEEHLGTRAFGRLRVGIGRSAEDSREIAGYVLGRFTPAERETLDRTLARAADQLECWLSEGPRAAMNRFNGSVLSLEK